MTATTDPKKVAEILKKENEKVAANRAYFAEEKKCRGAIRAKEWAQAERSCKRAILLVDKLPKEHVLERSSARESLGLVRLWQRRPEEAIVLFNESLAIGKSEIDDSDAETGEIYYFIGQSYHLLRDVASARAYYERAEKTYRTAFAEIGNDDIRFPYPRMIRNIAEAHYLLVSSAGLESEAEKMRSRLAQVEKEFEKYLVK